MPAIESRLKDLLDETRLAMMGTQLLMGLQYNAAFSQRFGSLPNALRWLDGVALLLILTTAAFLLATPAYHQIAAGGRPGHRPHVDPSIQQLKDRSAAAFARPRNR
jgi:hypothetical protein